MTQVVKIAVVGCGYWGAKHVRVLHEAPGVRAAVAADSNEQRLEYIKNTYTDIQISPDFEDIINSDAEGVIIATPISTHYRLAKRALEHGKHVLVEKPLAMSSGECLDLMRLAERTGRVIMVGHTFEYHPAVIEARKIIQKGYIGDIFYARSQRLNLGLYQRDANVLWDLAPHDLSIIFRVLEADVEKVDAWGSCHAIPMIEDVVHSRLSLDNGAVAHIHVSWLDPVKVRNFTVVGSEGMLVFDDSEAVEKLRIFDKGFKPVVEGDAFADFQNAYRHGEVFTPKLEQVEPLKSEILDFANAIRTGQQPLAKGASGLRVVKALERIDHCIVSDPVSDAHYSDQAGDKNIVGAF